MVEGFLLRWLARAEGDAAAAVHRAAVDERLPWPANEEREADALYRDGTSEELGVTKSPLRQNRGPEATG